MTKKAANKTKKLDYHKLAEAVVKLGTATRAREIRMRLGDLELVANEFTVTIQKVRKSGKFARLKSIATLGKRQVLWQKPSRQFAAAGKVQPKIAACQQFIKEYRPENLKVLYTKNRTLSANGKLLEVYQKVRPGKFKRRRNRLLKKINLK